MNESRVIKVEETKESFREKISDLLEDMWEKIGRYHQGISGGALRQYEAPDADLSESENVLTYSLELPGLDENNVEVVLDSGRLIIRGEKQEEREETGRNYIFRERRYGCFERSFVLPANVEQDHVQAGFDKGVLKVTVPYKVSGDTAAKKIEIAHS